MNDILLTDHEKTAFTKDINKWFETWGGYPITNDLWEPVSGPTGEIEPDFYGGIRTVHKSERVPLQIYRVRGSFMCKNDGLETLDGAPRIVEGNFVGSYNELETLDGTLESVGNQLIVMKNKLKTIQSNISCHMLEVSYNAPLHSLDAPTQCKDLLVAYGLDLDSARLGTPNLRLSITAQSDSPYPIVGAIAAKSIGLESDDLDFKIKMQNILNNPKWRGQGRKGAMRCIAALVEAGLEEWAGW